MYSCKWLSMFVKDIWGIHISVDLWEWVFYMIFVVYHNAQQKACTIDNALNNEMDRKASDIWHQTASVICHSSAGIMGA